MSLKFAIIGAGLTGTALFCQFVQKVQQRSERKQTATAEIVILIFERQEVLGPGFPHNAQFVMPYHITNMCDQDMGIIAGKPDDFQQWVNANPRILQEYTFQADFASYRGAGSSDGCRHYPRAVMGEYLKARFQDSLRLARDLDLKVELHPNVEVTNLESDGHGIILHAKQLQSGNAFSKRADRVLIATGHWFEQSDLKNYFTSPWPASNLLHSIPAGEDVGVIGTSLSAIETVLTLTSDGSFSYNDSGELFFLPSNDTRKIALYSRRGMLPKVRGCIGSYRNQYLTRENLIRHQSAAGEGLALKQIFQWLNSDLESAYGRAFNWEEVINPSGSPVDLLQESLIQAKAGDGHHGELIWQTVLHQSFPLARELFLSLAPAERERFEREFATFFFVHAATQPVINAEKMLALLKSGIVTVHQLGQDYRFFKDKTRDLFVFNYHDASGKLRRDCFRYVINARGQEKSLKTNPSVLAQNLLESQIVQTHELTNPGSFDKSGANKISMPTSGKTTDPPGSVKIDPTSHRIVTTGRDGRAVSSPYVYAVGAMTRGQIIDASMAYGIALSTAAIAEDWVNSLMSHSASH